MVGMSGTGEYRRDGQRVLLLCRFPRHGLDMDINGRVVCPVKHQANCAHIAVFGVLIIMIGIVMAIVMMIGVMFELMIVVVIVMVTVLEQMRGNRELRPDQRQQHQEP